MLGRLQDDGTFTYFAPDNDTVDPGDSFTYNCMDPSGAISNTSTVLITILPSNDDPVLDNILTRVTLPASIALAFIAIIPTLVNQLGGVEIMLSYFFGGTSIIIAVGVALDTMQQIEGQLVSRHYDSFLKTGKIKGRSRNRY